MNYINPNGQPPRRRVLPVSPAARSRRAWRLWLPLAGAGVPLMWAGMSTGQANGLWLLGLIVSTAGLALMGREVCEL